ncbi:MAG: hypothetical protein ACQXXF_08705 [Thermoplasmatota archaeon]|jgi:hypothetical protein
MESKNSLGKKIMTTALIVTIGGVGGAFFEAKTHFISKRIAGGYERLSNEPYLATISEQELEHISIIRGSVQKLKSLIENEFKNKSELESLIQELKKVLQ